MGSDVKWAMDSAGKTAILGTGNNGTLDGTGGYNEIFDAGPGQHLLLGGMGSDSYVFNAGDGQESIKAIGGNDQVLFGPGISEDDVYFTDSGTNLEINFFNSNDQITIQQALANNTISQEESLLGTEGFSSNLPGLPVQNFQFADGTDLSFQQVENDLSVYAASANSTVDRSTVSYNETIYGISNNIIKAGSGDDTIYGGSNATINAGCGTTPSLNGVVRKYLLVDVAANISDAHMITLQEVDGSQSRQVLPLFATIKTSLSENLRLFPARQLLTALTSALAFVTICSAENFAIPAQSVHQLNLAKCQQMETKAFEYAKSQQYNEAISEYTSAIELNPASWELYSNRANILALQGRYKEALQDHEKAIHLKPTDCIPWTNRGLTFCRMHEYKNALTDFDKAIELAAWNADAYYFRGVVKKKLGDIESGNKDISRAIQMNKNIEPQCSQLLPNNF